MTWFSLLPNARTELAAVAGPPMAGGSRRRVSYGVEIRADGAPVAGQTRIDVGAEVLGAGDVVGLDPKMIARIEPPQGATGIEPNYMPFIEFVDADFPWRYSFDSAQGARVKPWLVLLALKPNEFEFLDAGRGPLPRIRIADPAASLPNLSQSWAFAHVHVAHGEQRSNDLAGLIATRPDMHLARLLCGRKLEPNTTYTLVLVPASEAGRLAGLGESSKASPFDAPAWSAGATAMLELPFYHRSSFITSVMEDFELLARRLKAFRITDASPVAKPIQAFAGAPGFYAGYSHPTASFEVQDALMRTDRSVQAFNTDPALVPRLKTTLEAVIAGETVLPGADGPTKEDPLVAMPPYGWRFRKQKTVDGARAQQGQIVDRINLDLKFRHVAGLGAETVRRNQEHFSRICWSQYREVLATNLALARLSAAQQLNSVLSSRHVAKLPSGVIATLAETVQDVAKLADGRSAAQLFAAAGVPASFASRALRRISAKRMVRAPAAGAADRPKMTTPMPSIPGDTSAVRVATPGVARRLPGQRFALPAEARQRVTSLFGNDALVKAVTLPQPAVTVTPIATATVAAAMSSLFTQLPSFKAKALIAGLATREHERLEPVLRSPVVSDPLVGPLRAFAANAILRGTDGLPNNSVCVVKENRAFIEAFLVGANHEMNNELRWREFPTDMRGTIFRRFWDRKRSPSDPVGDDISEIHRWTQVLGSNFPPHDVDRKEALVLIVRGDIIRKNGHVLIVLNRATGTTYVHGQGGNREPVFSGLLSTDTAYFGFDVARETVLADKARHFFVLYEVPGRVRFGLDIATAAVRRDRFAFRTAPLAFPLAALGRDATAPLLPAHFMTGNRPPTQPATWDQLSWAHLLLDHAGYIDVDRSSPNVPQTPNYWGANRDPASIARSFWQKPVAAVLPASRVL